MKVINQWDGDDINEYLVAAKAIAKKKTPLLHAVSVCLPDSVTDVLRKDAERNGVKFNIYLRALLTRHADATAQLWAGESE